MSRRKGYTPKGFESDSRGNDTSANIYESMLQSAAFMDLTKTQRLLYLYMKAQYYGKRKPCKDYPDVPQFKGDDLFYFPLGLAERYRLYSRSNNRQFYSDIAALEGHGFIKIVSSGRNTKTKSIYQYSGDWKLWKP